VIFIQRFRASCVLATSGIEIIGMGFNGAHFTIIVWQFLYSIFLEQHLKYRKFTAVDLVSGFQKNDPYALLRNKKITDEQEDYCYDGSVCIKRKEHNH